MQKDLFDVQNFPSLEGLTTDQSGTALQVLIATEEIIGPVRNGGIASTYYHLARGLAAEGHKVTVLYLKGRVVENETPEHWIEHYASFGIDLVYLPAIEEPLACASEHWQWRWLSFYRWLKANDHFDLVHTSEWRGGAFYCLQAKRLGLAFQNTLFAMKTSSPYIWNRHYQMRPIDKDHLVVAAYAEQKCVEWSDIVIGGSAHLLSFMDHIGYRLPEGRTYVQPNIIDFSEVIVDDVRPERAIGERMETKELVFFGRLEPRKGLELFVFAIDALVGQGVQIDKITFLGKEGEKLQGQGNLKPIEFIEAHAADWPFPIEIVSDRNQPEALSLMCSREMIAVMPSLIENSTMAVYEALVHRIPFIATNVGGTPELIDKADHGYTLVPPEVAPLAERIAQALEQGQPVAKPAFENTRNLEVWYGFHRHLAEHGHEMLLPRPADPTNTQTIAYVSVPDGEEALTHLIAEHDPSSSADVGHVVMVSFVPSKEGRQTIDAAKAKGFTIIEMIGASVGDCFNRAREASDADIQIFDAVGAQNLDSEFYSIIRTALAARPDTFLTSLFHFQPETMEDKILFVPLGADLASQALLGNAYGVEFIIGRREAFDALGPFDGYRVAAGTVHEFVGRAAESGGDLMVIPEPLYDVEGDESRTGAGDPISNYLVRKAALTETSLAVRKLLLMDARQVSGAASKSSSGPLIMGKAHRPPDGVAWLTNVERKGHVNDPIRPNNAIYLGFDRESGTLHIAIRHTGEVKIMANKAIVSHLVDHDTKGQVEVSSINVMPFLENQAKTHLRIELINEDRVRAAGLAVQELEPDVYYLSSHRPIYWGRDFWTLLDKVEQHRIDKMARANKTEPNAPKTSEKPSAPAAEKELETTGIFQKFWQKISK